GIEVVGESLNNVIINDFKLTSNLGMELLPKFLVDVISPYLWMRPKVDENYCVMCEECVEACPTKAMKIPSGGSIPMVNKELCINCWCCHEICPENAIYIDKSWLAKKFIR
ncbi:MAG: ATP-binding protein, partial [Candidatus Zixiibacteriota bacterium]